MPAALITSQGAALFANVGSAAMTFTVVRGRPSACAAVFWQPAERATSPFLRLCARCTMAFAAQTMRLLPDQTLPSSSCADVVTRVKILLRRRSLRKARARPPVFARGRIQSSPMCSCSASWSLAMLL